MNYLELSFLSVLLAIIPFGSNGLQNCYICDSTNQNCVDGPFDAFSKPCTTKCFTKSDNGKVSRGCLAQDDNTCTGPNCVECTTDNCNVQKTCWVCDSKTNPACLLATAVAANINVCAAASPNCVVQITTDKTVSRGCASDEEQTKCAQSPDTCHTCTKSNCNEGIFPTKRLLCYQCNGANCNDASQQTAQPCALYEKADKCFTYGTSDTTMIRGCNSDTNAQCPASSTDAACFSCGSNNCNNPKYSRQSKCMQCDSSKDKDACAGEMKEADAKPCAKEFKYNEVELCYVQLMNNTVYRGCSNDRPTELGNCATQNSSCTACTSDGCNRMDAGFTCIRCRSDENAQCKKEADKIPGQLCTNTTNSKAGGCYIGTWNNVVIRGCTVDASASMQYQCKNKDDKTCSLCDQANCNTGKAGASALSGLGSLLLMLIATLTWRFH